jgi:hypothetical protein
MRTGIATAELQGLVMTNVHGDVGDGSLVFSCIDGRTFTYYHDQDCCEVVSINDIMGDLQDLVDTPILKAEEATTQENPPGADVQSESFTWTFYRFTTIKGTVVVRWYGSSNGYYSESVTLQVTGGKGDEN